MNLKSSTFANLVLKQNFLQESTVQSRRGVMEGELFLRKYEEFILGLE